MTGCSPKYIHLRVSFGFGTKIPDRIKDARQQIIGQLECFFFRVLLLALPEFVYEDIAMNIPGNLIHHSAE